MITKEVIYVGTQLLRLLHGAGTDDPLLLPEGQSHLRSRVPNRLRDQGWRQNVPLRKLIRARRHNRSLLCELSHEGSRFFKSTNLDRIAC